MKKGVVGIAGMLAVMVWAPLLGAFQATQAGQVPPPVAPLSREFAPKPYTVAAGDKIRLEFYNLVASDLDMKKDYLVEPDGTIQVKHVGPVNVHGRTAPEIADLVKKALEPDFYPLDVIQVIAVISEERVQRVQVQGQVVTPGEKPLRGNQMTVSRAIAVANGFTPMAGQEIEIQRVVEGKQVVISVTRTQLDSGDDPPLVSDDIVTVKTGSVFFVDGEVNSPGQKVWAPDMTAGKAVAMSSGMTTKGKWGYIERPVKGADGKVLRYIRIKGKDLKAETPILPDDRLHIARKWFG